MTDQSTHEQWTRPTRTLERAGPDKTEPDSAWADRADLEQANPEHAVGVARMPDAVPGPDPQPAEERDGVAVAAGTGEPVDDIDEAGDPAGGQAPNVPASVDDDAAPDVAGAGELLPGDVPAEPVALFDSADRQRFQDRWQQLQLRFVDDPHTVAAQAGALADEVVNSLRDAVDQHRGGLEDWQSDDGVDAHFGDTERLRVAVRRYRDFVDRLLAM